MEKAAVVGFVSGAVLAALVTWGVMRDRANEEEDFAQAVLRSSYDDLMETRERLNYDRDPPEMPEDLRTCHLMIKGCEIERMKALEYLGQRLSPSKRYSQH